VRSAIEEAVYMLGVETDWSVDVVRALDGRLLIVPEGTRAATGEILPDGTRVTFDEPLSLEGLV
jgi:hypothetical protein